MVGKIGKIESNTTCIRELEKIVKFEGAERIGDTFKAREEE